MNFLKVTGKDIKRIVKNRFVTIAVIAIIIVPLLYSLLYLDAFWDPYSKLDKMPVAVVNLDKGTTVDGSNVNYGNDITNKLKDSKDIGWSFVSKEAADEGVKKRGGYYAEFIIPEDFSQKVSSAKTSKPEQATIVYIANEKKNFLAAQINSKVELTLKAEITKTITDNYTKVTFDNLYKAEDGMAKAADGSKELTDGLEDLNTNIPKLSDGVNQLYAGSKTLSNGIGQVQGNIPSLTSGIAQLYTGSSKVTGGLNQLNGNIPRLTGGVSKLYSGSKDLSTGLGELNSKLPKLKSGVHQLYSGSQSINNGLEKLDVGLSQAATGTSNLTKGLSTVKASVPKLISASSSLTDGAKEISEGKDRLQVVVANTTNSVTSIGEDLQAAIKANPTLMKDPNIQKALTTLRQLQESSKGSQNNIEELFNGLNNFSQGAAAFSNGAEQLAQGLTPAVQGAEKLNETMATLKTGADSLYTGSSNIVNGLKSLDTEVPALTAGIGGLYDGSKVLKEGLGRLNGQTSTMANGISGLYKGSLQVTNGLKEVNGKIPALSNGINSLKIGSIELTSGLSDLNGQVPTLTTGTKKLYNGSKELSTKLTDGVNELKDGLKNNSDDMGNFVSEPVETENTAVNPVPNYGGGFASYFIPLSLWIGALMIFFVINPRVNKEDEKIGNFNAVFGKYLSFGAIGLIQAVCVTVVVMGLGLKPISVMGFILVAAFASLVFVAIIQMFVSLFGDAGRLIVIVLLILQLTSCGGLFPLELVPSFFRTLNPYVPFTYTVQALKEVISSTSIDTSLVLKDMGLLLVFGAVSMVISIVFRKQGEALVQKIEAKKAI